MADECIFCGSVLRYFENDTLMTCEFCKKTELSKIQCINGHYVCNECHTKDVGTIVEICIDEKSNDPIYIANKLMQASFCHMHGPEHHVIVGAALLTAYKNAGGEINLQKALLEIIKRGKAVPGGVCGFWGACGAGISTGIFISIVTASTPLAQKPWELSNQMTSCSLAQIAKFGGPRCCKRDSCLAINSAIDFTKDKLGIEMHRSDFVCTYYKNNNQCIGGKCPFKAMSTSL
ncbi:MAG: DUF5714 domain-containing protein [Coriobacteriales bacterium]|nr:DUF5714 domain-containing protein [Coriobacteriales bacterium]